MKKIIYLFIVAIITVGCSSSQPTIKSYTDKFSGAQIQSIEKNFLPKKGAFSLTSVQMNALRTSKIDSLVEIQMVYTSMNGWLFIKDGKSLNIKIDGKIYNLTTLDSPNQDVLSAGAVKEIANYPVEPKLLYKIGTGKTVMVRLVGQKGSYTRTLSEENKNLFLKFYSEFYKNK